MALPWPRRDAITPWTKRSSTRLPYVLILEATDGSGASRAVERTIHLVCELV